MQIPEQQLHHWLVLLVFMLAVPTVLLLLRVNAPYGRFTRSGWGPTMPARFAWILFESPAVVVFSWIYFTGDNALQTAPLVLLAIWLFHYLPRTFLFPFLIRDTGKRIPAVIAVTAIVFNVLNAYVNARWISHFGSYGNDWPASAPFIAGVALFVLGWSINQQADYALRRLRGPGETHYAIPEGGLYRHISCPNYFGEILEWIGWAVLTWSLAGAAFAVFTTANLLPRALASHRWYRATFDDYPATRRAVIPFLL